VRRRSEARIVEEFPRQRLLLTRDHRLAGFGRSGKCLIQALNLLLPFYESALKSFDVL
jgi:hypothetical protein